MSTDRTGRLSADIATVIRGLLAERDTDIVEFSALIGRPNSTVHRWLKGGGKFDTDSLEAMAEGLGMDAGELVSLAISRRAERSLRKVSPAERADLDRARQARARKRKSE